ncbi:MAG: amidohydrolase family protein, partial [Xanthomonadales bacterium]|nr:amidohydrolase family protein [Xanthomonadales bacterium]
DGSRLSIAEMLRSGTTCFNDMYFYPDVTARVATHAGIRAMVGLIVVDFPSAWADSIDTYFDKALALHDQLRNDPLVHTAFAPHAPYSVSDAPLQRALRLSNELDLPIHMHVHETTAEVASGLERYGCRPLERLRRMGLITPGLIGVHMTQLEDEEIELYAQQGAKVVHCPQSNLKLASGHCPVTRLREAGITVALGTDGAASNNNLDMWEELHLSSLLPKGILLDAEAMPAQQAVQLATSGGAAALGDRRFGTLAAGKLADICVIDLATPHTTPRYTHESAVYSYLAYSAQAADVRHTIANGRLLMRDREVLSLNEAAVLREATDWLAGTAG